MMNGVPVFDTEIVVNFSPNGEVAYTDFNVNKTLKVINTIPQIAKDAAIAISDRELQVSGMVNSQESKLFVYSKAGITKLTYRIFTSFEEKSGGWEVFVDANSGEILSVKDIAIYCGKECNDNHNHKKLDESALKPKSICKKHSNYCANICNWYGLCVFV